MKKNTPQNRFDELQKRAKALLDPEFDQIKETSSDEIRKLIHNLHTYQIELSLQNEELRTTQSDLEESRTLYRDLYDSAPVGYFTFDNKGSVLAANLPGCQQLGMGRNTLLSKPFSSFMSQEDSDLFYLHLQKVCATENKQTCALTIFPEKGTPFYAQLDTIPAAVTPGSQPRYQTTVTDISQRKELEEAQKISETRYRQLFEAAREGILILNAKTGQIADANPSLMEMLGYSHTELFGKRLWELGCFKDIKASKKAFKQLQREGYARYEDLPLETKDGRPIAVEVISNTYLEKSQKMIQCNIRDVTSNKIMGAISQGKYRGKNRRLAERRAEPRLLAEQVGKKIEEHLQAEKSILKALAEIKSLKNRLVAEHIYFRQESRNQRQFRPIIGESDGIKYVLYRAEQVAPSNTTVLLLGETGTGKELIAAAIHNLSPRKDRSLITVNCAALPANLLESELFGREKGAFTGAETRQIGRFELADGSTLCLDEIGELPLEMQAKLLRVIQHGQFERLGSPKTIKVNVRIVATTNRNLEEEIAMGKFRKDLYYRLNVFPITVPPLRQRKEDIPAMVESFVERYAKKLGKRITSIPKETMKVMQHYSWPGNVRELESIIERSVILCPGPGFQLADNLCASSSAPSLPKGTVKEMERNLITQVLMDTNWRIEGKDGAAIILGFHPSTLRARMHKLGIVRPTAASE